MRYTKPVHDFVRENVKKYSDTELAEKCNELFNTEFTESKIKAFRKNHKYKRGRTFLKGEAWYKQKKCYPEGMYEYIRDNSWGVSAKDMARIVGEKFGVSFTETQMHNFRKRNKIRCGNDTRFKKGCVAANKGRKMEEFMTPEAIERVKSTWYKKGRKPHNVAPLGTVVMNVEGYYLIKVRMTGKQCERWRFLHQAVWEEHNGPIPPGMIISFKDGNKENCDISNLMMITYRENQNLNTFGYRSSNPELTEAGLNLVKLKIAIKDKKGKQ